MKKNLLVLLGSISLIFVLAVLPFLAACAKPAPKPAPVSAADFYKDNTVTVVCVYKAGAGTDFAARLVASYWTEVTGGSMVVKNMTGGGGLVGVNYVSGREPDGLTLGIALPGGALVSPVLFEDPAAEFELAKINWIGAVSYEPWAFSIASGLPYESMEDLQKVKGFKFGSLGLHSPATLWGALIIEYFGLQDAKIITGYTGSSDVGLAAGRMEVDGAGLIGTGIISGTEKGFFKPAFMVLDHERSVLFPDVPALPELVDLTSEQETQFTLVTSLSNAARSFFTTPGVPEDRVQFIRDAFVKIVDLEPFRKQHKLKWPVWTEPFSGEYLTEFAENAMALPKEEIAKLDQLVNKYAVASK